MKRRNALAACVAVAVIAGCGASVANDQLTKVDEQANKHQTFIPRNNVERNNYEKAQKLYDSPSTIIWCSTTWGNASAPIVTVPIAGKLTSSSVSFFPSTRAKIGGGGDSYETDEYTPERRSVDGMYHGTPPPYRYGFTPGGQYVDLFNMPTFCTTALTKFQRQKTQVAVEYDEAGLAADAQAEDALKRGDKAGAERILKDAVGGGQ
jgi:hypothetical protein